MTETEWLASEDPRWMLHWLTCAGPSGSGTADLERWKNRPSDRKLQNLCDAWRSDICGECRHCMAYIGVSPDDKMAPAFSLAINILGEFKPIAAHLLRDIVGNPFHEVVLPKQQRICSCSMYGRNGWVVGFKGIWEKCDRCKGSGTLSFCPWLTTAVTAMARSIYEERRFEDMPILGDALEEAGCDNEEILRHCRGQEQCPTCLGEKLPDTKLPITGKRIPTLHLCCMEGRGWIPLRGPHVRGCWVLDLLLGQE